LTPNSEQVLKLIDRLKKDAKGSLTTILILGAIKEGEGSSWGYGIKQHLRELTDSSSEIKDSSLYTILKSLEIKYNLIKSETREKRRYYALTELGEQDYRKACEFWYDLIRTSINALEILNFPIKKRIKEEFT